MFDYNIYSSHNAFFLAAIRGIKRQHLNEIKSFKTPPQAICDVLSAVLMLKGTKDLSWNSMKAFLSKRGMIDEIINFDVNVVPPQTVTKVMALVQKKEKSFEKSVISRVSVAAAPLASWVTTNLEHLNIIKSIQPLETQLSEMNRNLEDCEKTLKEYENSVKELDERVIQLKSDFATKTKEAGMLKQRLLVARRRSDTATRLIEQLSGEFFIMRRNWLQSLIISPTFFRRTTSMGTILGQSQGVSRQLVGAPFTSKHLQCLFE